MRAATTQQDSMDSTGPEGAIDALIREFNDFEAEEKLFSNCVDEAGFAWWDATRYAVQWAICVERDIGGRSAAGPSSVFSRALRLTNRLVHVVKDVATIALLRRNSARTLFVCGRTPRSILDDIAASPGPCFVASNHTVSCTSLISIRKRSIDLLIRAAVSLGRGRCAIAADAARLDQKLKRRFGSHVDFRCIIIGKYRQHRASRAIWDWVLSRLGSVELIGYVNDDTAKSLVALARRRGIRTREYQHGYMGRSHIAFSYPRLEQPLATLPDEVVVNFDSGDITYPAAVINAGASGQSSTAAQARRDIDVLVGGSPTRNAEALAIVANLVDRGLSVAIKLHPAQSEASSGVRQAFSSNQLSVHSGEEDFRSLAARSKIYVPANPSSTTAFEAVECGARLLVVDYSGMKMTSSTDAVVSARVNTIESVYGAVAELLQASSARASLCAGSV
jgi:hypothetical protein